MAGMVDEERIARMQSNLSVIRKVARWTADRLGEEIGVSRQTINSLEHGKSKMSKTQYLALRAVFNHEAMVSNNAALAQVIQTLVDEPIEDIAGAVDEGQIEGGENQTVDVMDAMSVTTNVLTDKKAVASIVAAVSAAALPGIMKFAAVPLTMRAIQKGGNDGRKG